MRLTLTIPGRLTQDVADFAAASAAYSQARDLSGEGCSTFPFGTVDCHGIVVAEVSYNGRIWDRGQHEGRGEDRLLYDPSGTTACAQPVLPALEAEAVARALHPIAKGHAALTGIVREMIYGDGTDASLQRVIDLCNEARSTFSIERA